METMGKVNDASKDSDGIASNAQKTLVSAILERKSTLQVQNSSVANTDSASSSNTLATKQGRKSVLTEEDLPYLEMWKIKIQDKLREYHKRIKDSEQNLFAHEKQLEFMMTASHITRSERKEKVEEIKKYKQQHLKFKSGQEIKIDRWEQALKDLQADLTKLKFQKASSGPTERMKSQDKIRTSDYCKIVEAKTYESKEVRFTQCEVLKVDLESESESETETPVPKVIERKCKVCSKVFTQQKNYQRHMREHKNIKKFTRCSKCPKIFSCAAALMVHMEIHKKKSMANNNKKCGVCEYSSTQRVRVLRHMRTKHTKEQIFSCSSCSQKFFSHSALEYHEKKHKDGSKKYCETCLKFYKKDETHKHCK
jgi:hypothetical protein